ncbi:MULTISPECIES: hypothetical protein [Falsihalocynthiibacter]|uniref:hypothetical protein n=1 Tax=Falsihalocynthiibacter TaxID=2854182 RepID=UPI00300342ED
MIRLLGHSGLVVCLPILSNTTAMACGRPTLAGTNKAIPSSGINSQSLLNNAILIEVKHER